MKIVVQRVAQARVEVGGEVVGSINNGLLALVGITHTDTQAVVQWMADKLVALRVFADEHDKMNRSVVDINGGILLVSQFTLYGNLAKGTRPSFVEAARPEVARPLFDSLVQVVKDIAPNIAVETGVFGAMMQVSLLNDGPVTIVLERNA